MRDPTDAADHYKTCPRDVAELAPLGTVSEVTGLSGYHLRELVRGGGLPCQKIGVSLVKGKMRLILLPREGGD